MAWYVDLCLSLFQPGVHFKDKPTSPLINLMSGSWVSSSMGARAKRTLFPGVVPFTNKVSRGWSELLHEVRLPGHKYSGFFLQG